MKNDSLEVISDGSPGLSVTGFETIAATAQTGRAATVQVLILQSSNIERFSPKLLYNTQFVRHYPVSR